MAAFWMTNKSQHIPSPKCACTGKHAECEMVLTLQAEKGFLLCICGDESCLNYVSFMLLCMLDNSGAIVTKMFL